jgi:hypothetical protein
MKKLVGLALFGLVVQMAMGQISELNTPTSIDLNCVTTWVPSPESEEVSIHIFGDNGLGYVSEDKGASWTELVIDPIKKRDINMAIRPNDTLLVISGGPENDLLKWSMDGGLTFKDLVLPNKEPVNGMGYSYCYYFDKAYLFIVFGHAKGMSIICVFCSVNWQEPYFSSDYMLDEDFSFYGMAMSPSSILLAFTFPALGGPPYDKYFTYQTDVKDLGYYSMVSGLYNHDRVTSLATRNNHFLFASKRDQQGEYNYEAYHTDKKNNMPVIRYFSSLTKEQSIKSSLVTAASSNYWHVGGDDFGKNGFIIKDGIIINTSPGFSMNAIAYAGWVSRDGNNETNDEVIMVGDQGKIFSNRPDLILGTSTRVVNLDELSLYPNPCLDQVTIYYSGRETIAALSDLLGRSLRQLRLETGNNKFSLADLKPGIYFITTKQNTLKFIKK